MSAVSAVIGVILLVCITLAIAATVYVYVEGQRDGEPAPLTVEGTVTSVAETSGAYENATIYEIVLGNEYDYMMLFRTEGTVVPDEGDSLRFYYDLVGDGYYDVYQTESL